MRVLAIYQKYDIRTFIFKRLLIQLIYITYILNWFIIPELKYFQIIYVKRLLIINFP